MEPITVPTIGGRSSFDYLFEEDNLYIRFGKMIRPLRIKDNLIQKVRERVNENPEPIKKASHYNQKKWPECNNNRISPYIAQLILLGKI
jgi:hypothetical protein